MSTRYPLDFDTVAKGDVIAVVDIESSFSCKFGTTEYSLRAMGLAQQIEQEMALRGNRPTTRIVKGAIHILIDEEASECNRQRFKRHLKGLRRDHARNLQVNVAALNDEQKTKHERTIIVQSNLLLALQKARKKLVLSPVTRAAPALEE